VDGLFILGAGFSRAISAEMPLVSELRDVVAPFGWPDDLGSLLQQLDFNIEHLLTYLATEIPFLSEVDVLRNRASFLQVSRGIGYAIGTIQDAVFGSTTCPDWLTTLVATWDTQRAPVVTFNYDSFVEKAYETLGPDSDGNQREREQLYSMPVAVLNSRSGVGVLGGSTRTTFPLLKLHGSCTWLYSGSERFYGETVFRTRGKRGWVSDEYMAEINAEARDKVPLIVPPTTDKSAFFANESVRAQWREASFQLRGYADVYIIGYSLPETDMLVRFLVSELDRGTRVTIVNKLRPETCRTADDVREAFVARYRALLPVDDSNINDDWVRVGDDVLPSFVDAVESGRV
jgi:hypothetical protein